MKKNDRKFNTLPAVLLCFILIGIWYISFRNKPQNVYRQNSLRENFITQIGPYIQQSKSDYNGAKIAIHIQKSMKNNKESEKEIEKIGEEEKNRVIKFLKEQRQQQQKDIYHGAKVYIKQGYTRITIGLYQVGILPFLEKYKNEFQSKANTEYIDFLEELKKICKKHKHDSRSIHDVNKVIYPFHNALQFLQTNKLHSILSDKNNPIKIEKEDVIFAYMLIYFLHNKLADERNIFILSDGSQITSAMWTEAEQEFKLLTLYDQHQELVNLTN